MDESNTIAKPDQPRLGNTVYFTAAGKWIKPVEFDHMNLKCHLFGALVYDEDFPEVMEIIKPGLWSSYSLPFDAPLPVDPSATYFITISGWGQDGLELFSIDTNFKFT